LDQILHNLHFFLAFSLSIVNRDEQPWQQKEDRVGGGGTDISIDDGGGGSELSAIKSMIKMQWQLQRHSNKTPPYVFCV